MQKLSRYMLIIPAAFLFGLMLTIVLDKPAPVCATCGSTMHAVRSKHTDRQTSDTVNGVTTNTEEITQISVVIGDKGDVFTENSSYKKNSDGSAEDHENIHAEDPEGCYENGEPWKGDYSSDDTTDAKGNRKWHQEDFSEKDGKCIKSVRDREWNAKGKLIKDTGWVKTDVPCVRTSLEVHWEGVLSMGSLSVEWGPETSAVPLAVKDKTYTGQFTGNWKGKLSSDACQCSGTFPVTIDVIGQEDEFEIIDFTVTINKGSMVNCVCEGKSNSASHPQKPEIYKFNLPAQGGASITMDGAEGAIKTKTTFTLKMK
jgi:hypothetical protein